MNTIYDVMKFFGSAVIGGIITLLIQKVNSLRKKKMITTEELKNRCTEFRNICKKSEWSYINEEAEEQFINEIKRFIRKRKHFWYKKFNAKIYSFINELNDIVEPKSVCKDGKDITDYNPFFQQKTDVYDKLTDLFY